MRPVIVNALNGYFGTGLFTWLVPDLPVVYAAAILVCTLIFVKRAKEAGLQEYHAWGAALSGTIAGIVGVRLWYLLANFDRVLREPSMVWDLNGPTVSFGGYLFGAAAFAGYLLWKRQDLPGYLDAAGSCLGLGPMIGRWACYLNGDDFGTLSSLPWAVRYPPGSYPFVDHVNRGYINLTADSSFPVHPVQLYLSLSGLLLFFICTWLWKQRRFRPGAVFGIFWLLYSFTRFLLEFFRGDYDVKYLAVFTPGQIACVVIFGAALLALARLHFAGERTASEVSSAGTRS